MAYLAALALERAHELRLSSRHEAALRARGAIESGRELHPWLVAVHAALPLLVIAEVLWLGARPARGWPLALAALALVEALRLWSMATLGTLWTTRVLVPPGISRVRAGPYRWLRHPSYIAAAIELAAGPLMFGAWRTALALSLVNLPLLVARARVEARALDGAAVSAP